MGVCLAGPRPLTSLPDPPFLRRNLAGLTIQLRAQPGARRSGLALTPQGVLKAAVTVPPEDGKANDAVIALLSKAWRMPKSTVAIVRGGTSREKTLSVAGDPAALAERIAEWVRENG